MFPNLLKGLLKELGYPNPSTELKLWRDKGALDCDGKHLTKKVSFKFGDKKMPRMYVLQIWQDVQPKVKKASKISLLLKNNSDVDLEDNEEVIVDEHTVT